MSVVIFRSCSIPFGALKRILTSPTTSALSCFLHRHDHASNVMKFRPGILQIQHRHSHWHSLYPRWPTTSDSHSHYTFITGANSVLTNTRDYSFGRPSVSRLAYIARYSSSSADSKLPVDKPKADGQPANPNGTDTTASSQEEPEKLSIYQRFKRTYKEHGKILVAVHVTTSIVWYGAFYMAAKSGIDIVPYLESAGFSDRIINPFRAGGLGDYALAYLMYKLATPARYTVTIGGTNMVIRLLRRQGKMPPKSEEDSLRQLMRQGRTQLRSNLRRGRKKRTKFARELSERAKRK